MALTLRTLKGSRLTHKELDDNFRHFTGSHTVDGTVTATAFVGDGSGLTGIVHNPDLTGTGILSGSIQIAELGAGIVSGSSQLDGEVFGFGADIVATGSFTGSFVGDGSGLTGISAGASAISGLSDVNLNALSDGEYLSYDAASTRWVNVAAPTADLTGTTVISGSNFEYDSSAQQWNVGKFVRFNGGLRATGFLAPIVLDTNSAVSTDPVLKVLGTNSTEELVVTNTEVQINDKLTLNSQFSNGGIIPTTDGLVTARVFHDTVRYVGHVSASLFSGSFVGDGSGLTGLPAADLTGTTVISGSGLEWASNPYVAWNFNEGVALNSRLAVYPSNTLVNNEGVKFTSANIGLQNSHMKFYQFGSNTNDIEINVQRGHISASAFSGSFSGSFYGDGSNLTGVTAAADLTGTGIVSGSGLEYDSIDASHWSLDNKNFELHNGGRLAVRSLNSATPLTNKFAVTDAGNNLFLGVNYAETNIGNQLIVGTSIQNALMVGPSRLLPKAVVRNDGTADFKGITSNGKIDFTTANQGVSGSFSGSFEGDGSGLTGLPAGNVPFIAGTTLPAKASSVTGSMILIDTVTGGFGNDGPELYIYNGAPGTGWRQIQFV